MKNLSPIISIIAGAVILLRPDIAFTIIGLFLIISGVIALVGKK